MMIIAIAIVRFDGMDSMDFIYESPSMERLPSN